MLRQGSKRSCWTSPKGHHNRWSLMAVVANQAVAFDKSMLTACRFKPANVIEHKEHTNMKPKNTICLGFEKDAHEAARFYSATFPDSKVTAVHEAPSDY